MLEAAAHGVIFLVEMHLFGLRLGDDLPRPLRQIDTHTHTI